MPYTVAAALRIKKKHVAEFTRLVKRHAANSITREAGCVAFEVSVDRDDPRRFIFYEIYITEADFDAHTQTPWVQAPDGANGPHGRRRVRDVRPRPPHRRAQQVARRFFCFPSGAGRSLRSLGYAPCGAPARSRRPGHCAARSRSYSTP